MAVLRFIQELLGIRPGITKGPQSRNVKKDVESERQHFLGADSGQCRGEDSGKPFPPLKKNRPEIDYQWWSQPLFQHGIDHRDQLAVFRRIDVSLGHDLGDLGHAAFAVELFEWWIEPLLVPDGQSLQYDKIDMFAAFKVPVNVGLRQADLARNIGKAHVFQSVFLEEEQGGAEDRFLALFDLGGLASPLESGQFGSWHIGNFRSLDKRPIVAYLKTNGLL